MLMSNNPAIKTINGFDVNFFNTSNPIISLNETFLPAPRVVYAVMRNYKDPFSASLRHRLHT